MIRIIILLLLCVQLSAQMSIPTPIQDSPPINETQAKSLAGLGFNNWGIQKLGLGKIIFDGNDGGGVSICICDTGVPTHKNYKTAIRAYYNPTTDTSAIDRNGHATHVGGIINEIAPRATLYFAKVLSDSGTGQTDWVVQGINWCISKKVDIINLSLGGGHTTDLHNSIKKATESNILVIAAVGNDGHKESVNNIIYPAKYPEAIGVGSINIDLEPSWFSSYGKEGEIMAAGEKILSTWLEDKYIQLSGTSMATPFVSGMAALYKSEKGELTTFEAAIKETATDMLEEGFDKITFNGQLEGDKAFSFSTDAPPPATDKPPTENVGFGATELLILGVVIVTLFVFIGLRSKK